MGVNRVVVLNVDGAKKLEEVVAAHVTAMKKAFAEAIAHGVTEADVALKDIAKPAGRRLAAWDADMQVMVTTNLGQQRSVEALMDSSAFKTTLGTKMAAAHSDFTAVTVKEVKAYTEKCKSSQSVCKGNRVPNAANAEKYCAKMPCTDAECCKANPNTGQLCSAAGSAVCTDPNTMLDANKKEKKCEKAKCTKDECCMPKPVKQAFRFKFAGGTATLADFQTPAFQTMLINAVSQATGLHAALIKLLKVGGKAVSGGRRLADLDVPIETELQPQNAAQATALNTALKAGDLKAKLKKGVEDNAGSLKSQLGTVSISSVGVVTTTTTTTTVVTTTVVTTTKVTTLAGKKTTKQKTTKKATKATTTTNTTTTVAVEGGAQQVAGWSATLFLIVFGVYLN